MLPFHHFRLSKNHGLLSTLIALLLLMSGCSSHLLRQNDYQESLRAHYHGSPEKALAALPEGEENTFIKTMETTYLKLLQGNPDIEALEPYSEWIDKRIRYDATREVKSFFYIELAEGYYASEHEVILLHMLLSWGYSLQGKYEKGCTEAQKSSHLLATPWSEEGRFDDPTLRLWVAGLWAMCGSWKDARADFEAAWKLDSSLEWAKALSEQENPPEQLILVLGGVGPTPYWDPNLNLNPLRGLRHLGFQYPGLQSKLTLKTPQGLELKLHRSPNSEYWYQRHFERDNAIQELIQDSHYGQSAVSTVSIESAKTASGILWGVAVGTASIIAGGGMVVVALIGGGGAGELAILGGLTAYTGIKYAGRTIEQTTEQSLKDAKKELNPAHNYRLVRFLPEYVWVGSTNTPLKAPINFQDQESENDSAPTRILARLSHPSYEVLLSHFTDVDETSTDPKIWYSFEHHWKPWKEEFLSKLSETYQEKVNWERWHTITQDITKLAGKFEVSDGFLDLGDKLSFSIYKDSISVEFRRGLHDENAILVIDLLKQSILADPELQEILLEDYSPLELLREINTRLYSVYESTRKSYFMSECRKENLFFIDSCARKRSAENPLFKRDPFPAQDSEVTNGNG